MRRFVAGLFLLGMISHGIAEDDVKTERSILKTFRDEFVQITPGTDPFPERFTLGTDDGDPIEVPAKTVTVTRPFAIAKYEVTQELYELIAGNNPSRWKGPRNSVEMITFAEAVSFCDTVTERLRSAGLIEKSQRVRLPTEAEWEYICRAGTKTRYSFGDEARTKTDTGKLASKLDPYAWHTGNAAGNDPPVGALKPNPWGLHDVHGYLWEFVADPWADSHRSTPAVAHQSRTEPKANADKPIARTIRGGSWRDLYTDHRSTSRRSFGARQRSDAVGFRCVLDRVSEPKSESDPNSTPSEAVDGK